MDEETEKTVRKVPAEEFKDRVVVMVVHRSGAIGGDRVVVMDRAKLVEVGEPEVLLNARSRFRELWHGGEGLIRE